MTTHLTKPYVNRFAQIHSYFVILLLLFSKETNEETPSFQSKIDEQQHRCPPSNTRKEVVVDYAEENDEAPTYPRETHSRMDPGGRRATRGRLIPTTTKTGNKDKSGGKRQRKADEEDQQGASRRRTGST